MKLFPVADVVGRTIIFTDDFGKPRGDHRHSGNDIFSNDNATKKNLEGAALFAVDDGVASRGTDDLGGNVVQVKRADGVVYYYAHLRAFEGSFPREVKAGDVIGYMGMTGSAKASGLPHLHFEIWPTGVFHPYGQGAVDPYSELKAAPIMAGGVGGGSVWPWIVGGLVLAGGGYFAWKHLAAKEHAAYRRLARSNPLDVLDVARSLQRESGLIFIPDVVRACGVSNKRATWARLALAAREGIIELRPESGLGRLSKEERDLCVPGYKDTLLSWMRFV